ncbi:hypothetical protein CEXT_205741 [Caerostris extrusa]|uniref:Uncharacterized protein n=1 Tax=Caerostris extrusa TaxID=172846 RepID=A0AAV4W3V5_CAEEX|nr:hypothetical protein CEXT_205741 [Caerostris extrusa]
MRIPRNRRRNKRTNHKMFRFIHSFAIHNFSSLTRDRTFLPSQGLHVSCAPQHPGKREKKERSNTCSLEKEAIKGMHCCVFIKAARLCSSALTELDDVGEVLQIFVS